MNQKLKKLALWCFLVAACIFALSFFLYHYMTPTGAITLEFHTEAGKPFVTEMLADLGVLFFFSGWMSLLVRGIFFPEK